MLSPDDLQRTGTIGGAMKEIVITLIIGAILLGVIVACIAIATATDYDPAWDEWEKMEKTDGEGDADDGD